MNGSPSSVLSLGFGSWGSTGLVVTLGFGIGVSVVAAADYTLTLNIDRAHALELNIDRAHATTLNIDRAVSLELTK